MLVVNNVQLPEIDLQWLKAHCAVPPSGGQPIEVLLESEPPGEDRHRGPGCNHNFDLGADAYKSTVCRISGRMIYPPGGYMDWHTNGDWPGRRMYAAWSETGQSGMLWFRDNKTVIDWDRPGWNIRTFVCPVWHAVFSKCWRVSVGWHLEEKPHALENWIQPA